VSYGTITYFGVNAFKFTSPQGKVTYGRYRIEPVAGTQFLTKQQISSADAGYLATELRQRLAKVPVRFNFVAQLAAAGDKLDDPSIAWPESRPRVNLGVIELTRVLPDSDAQERALLFQPLSLPPGIEAADPMLKARTEAYPVSYARRHQTEAEPAHSPEKPVFSTKLPNVPGKSLTAIVVNYAPGGKSPAHAHAGSVFAYVLAGQIRSENSATGPAKIYQAGESFFEPPGSTHLISENGSTTEPASLLAIFVADDGATLTRAAH
jgi:quercetin dioxygenase-like cupin family protein